MEEMRRLAFLFIAVLAAIPAALAPERALAKGGDVGPDGLPFTSAKHPWKVFTGDPSVDVLPFSFSDVVPAASRQLKLDDWTIFIEQRDRGVVVTRWKQMHHPLIWLFMGKTMARVTVQMRPIGATRTQVIFRGDLASHRTIDGNPLLPAAKRAYAKAAFNWRHDVTEILTSRGASR